MFELLKVMVIMGSVIIITGMVLLALPQCRLRDLLMPYVAWSFVVLCGLYAISPIDALPEVALGPFGLVDDLAAMAAGIGTAVATIKAQRKKHPNYQDPYFN
jgi:uncharacterized membrane protein YkvA (DUF1232 family)